MTGVLDIIILLLADNKTNAAFLYVHMRRFYSPRVCLLRFESYSEDRFPDLKDLSPYRIARLTVISP